MTALERDGRTTATMPRPNTGALASAAWLAACELSPVTSHWSVLVLLDATPRPGSDVTTDAQLTIEIFAEEWGFALRRADRRSWIRITDMPFVHGVDDFALLPRTPHLHSIHRLVRELEHDHAVTFDRSRPQIRSSFGGEDIIAAWARSL